MTENKERKRKRSESQRKFFNELLMMPSHYYFKFLLLCCFITSIICLFYIYDQLKKCLGKFRIINLLPQITFRKLPQHMSFLLSEIVASAKNLPQPSASFRNTCIYLMFQISDSARSFRKLPQASATHELLDVWNSWFVTKSIKLCQETNSIQ